MKRIILLVTVALVMAAMLMVTGPTAFADPPADKFHSGPCAHTIGKAPQAGGDDFQSLSGCEPYVEHNNSKRKYGPPKP